MSGTKILIVPATRRNAILLGMYIESLKNKSECLFLRTKAFGEAADIGAAVPIDKAKVISADFLLQSGIGGEWQKIKYQKRNHSQLKDYLLSLQVSTIVIGNDGDSIGKWVALVAKEVGIPTLACQEGSWLFCPYIPLSIRLKIHALNFVCRFYYRPFKIHIRNYYLYYQDADYYALWGEFDRDILVKNGAQLEQLFLVGYPNDKKFISKRGDHKIEKVLFLDFPGMSMPRGSIDNRQLNEFRKGVVAEFDANGIRVLYKPHPFTRTSELEATSAMLKTFANVTLVTSGTAEQYFSDVDMCITFPSTCVYTIYADLMPIVILYPKFRFFNNVFADPVKKYGAGFSVSTVDEIKKVIGEIRQPGWYTTYVSACEKAAESLAGSQDGKAPERFENAIDAILERHQGSPRKGTP